MSGIIGKKIGMTRYFDEDGRSIPCTLIQAEPNVVTQVKTIESDGYNAVQLATGEKKPKNTTKALMGHFAKSNTTPKVKLAEFEFDKEFKTGDTIGIELFEEGEFVDISGYSKGKGFQGVVKRHGFAGVGGQTHGQHNRLRAPGSLGASSYPSRVFKGMRMAGRTGNNKIKVFNLQVVKSYKDKNIILIKGSVPGYNGSYLIIEK